MPFTTLAFNDFDPVTGPPTVDGLTRTIDPGVITDEIERGYVQGGRLAFGGGSAFPPVVVDAVRVNEELQLGIFCAFDLSFDDGDTIVVAVKPTAGSPADTARRIDIHPVFPGVGADSQLPNGSPAGDPDDSPPGVPAGMNFRIRGNKTAARLEHWRGTSSTSPRWTTENPDGTAYAPPGVQVRARSWVPPAATLTTTAEALTLPAPTIQVLDATRFPEEDGLIQVGGNLVTYQTRTSSTFQDCAGGSGAVPAGTAVSIPEMGWSAELRIPLFLRESDGESPGIELSPDGFGLFIDVIRAGVVGAAGSDPVGGAFAAQYLFPTTAPLTGTVNQNLAIATYGTGLVPPLQSPAGSNTGVGVQISGGELGIGARLASAGPFSALSSGIDRNNDNHLVTQVENTDTTSPAAGVTSEVRIANWGMPPADFAAWEKAPGAAPNPSDPKTVTAGTPEELIVPWAEANIPPEYEDHKHQCMFVQLTANTAVNFVSSSERRNMDFVPLSEVERPAEISGKGYPAPGGGRHDFLLVVNTRLILPARGGDGGDGGDDGENLPDINLRARTSARKASPVFLWIVHGYRITGESLTIRGRKYGVLDPGPGQFGYIAEHDDPTHALTSQLAGANIQRNGNVYRLRVPHDGTVTIQTRVEAAPARRLPKNGCSLLRLLKDLFDKLRGK